MPRISNLIINSDSAVAAMAGEGTPSMGMAAPAHSAARIGAKLAAGDGTSMVAPEVLAGIVRLLDLAIVAGIGLMVFWFYVEAPSQADTLNYLFTCLIAGGVTVMLFQGLKLYSITALGTLVRQSIRVWLAWGAVLTGFVLIAFFTKFSGTFSRVWLLAWFISAGTGLMVVRAVVAATISGWSKSGRLSRNAVIIGGSEAGERLIEELNATSSDIRICGIVDDRGDDRVQQVVAGYEKIGSVDDLVEFARNTRIDLLVVALPITAETRILEILKKLWVLPVDIRLAAHTSQLQFRPKAYSFLGKVPVMDISDKPITGWDKVMKQVFDKVIATAAIIGLSPVMALVALAIKLDSRGPVLFKQKRYGFNNELVEVYKFRSMYTDQSDGNAVKLVTKGDPRVTPVGRFIRRTSLDELPQLFNVLTGSLSLVGPRPHALQAKAASHLYQDVVDGYFARHKVKPGITGWAQINGWRGETDTDEKIQKRVEHDIYYIENWSVFFDAYILARTPLALLKTENAY